MSGQRQQFTFIDVTAQKRVNRTKVKSHAAGDANRRKRQEAVQRYQEEVLRQAERCQVDVSSQRTQSIATESSEHNTPPVRDNQPSEIQKLAPNIADVQILNTSLRDEQEQRKSQWKELYRDSWAVFQTSLMKRKLILGGSHNDLQPITWLQKRTSSPNEEVTSTTITGVVELRHPQVHAHIPRIDPPVQFEQVRQHLTQIQTFLRGRHDATWRHHIRLDPFHYQHDYEVGVWRECFFLAFDQLAIGKSSTAFAIMDTAFGAASVVVKKQHPSLLYAMLEVMHEARNIQDSKLISMIQRYLAQLTGTLLGMSHPVALLMRSITDHKDQAQWSESLFRAVVGLLAELFGSSHFQTLGTQFGSLRGCMNDRNQSTARDILSQIEDVWNVVFPPGSIPLHVLHIEKARVADMTDNANTEIAKVLDPAIDAFEELAVMTAEAASAEDHRHASSTTSNQAMTRLSNKETLPPDLRRLGRTLASGSYHALTLYMYTHVHEIFVPPTTADNASPLLAQQIPFAAQVVQIMRNAMRQSPGRRPT